MTVTAKKFNELMEAVDKDHLADFRHFIKELNRREKWVRFDDSGTFDEYETSEGHGYGFSVDGKAVPYFHPNRSFHDEIIWLNEHLFYEPTATLSDKIVNAAVVKFYGPSRTLEIITEGTGKAFVQADRFFEDRNYQLELLLNLERSTESIYGTTELRTSLQTASRNYARETGSAVDFSEGLSADERALRRIRRSDVLNWFTLIGPQFVEFFSQKPTMEGAFRHLTSHRGIGNYYGYHFASNLARMPEVGTLVRTGAPAGNLSEDDEFVVAGVGAASSLDYLFGKGNEKRNREAIQLIRKNQDEWFDFSDADGSANDARIVTELGFFTHFGVEISLCQWNVYRRLKESESMAANRAKAPISKLAKSRGKTISDTK